MTAPPTADHPRDTDLPRARALGIDSCGRIAAFWGFTRTMGRVFGLLYLSADPLPQVEIQRQLGISAGTASMTLRDLQRWGVAHRVWVRGERREHYTAETDFWKMIAGVLNERERREIGAAVKTVSEAQTVARQSRAAARGPARDDADFTTERLDRLGEICRLGETMLDMLLGQMTLDVGQFRDALRVEGQAGVSSDAARARGPAAARRPAVRRRPAAPRQRDAPSETRTRKPH